MRIEQVRLHGFRNLQDSELCFSPGVNLILGENAQGKTNLLEALDYICLGRSPRGGRGEDLIAFGADSLHVSLAIADCGDGTPGTTLFEYALQRGGNRRVRVAGEPVHSRSQLVGRFAAVFFDPDSLEIVRGEPENRRRFVDSGLSLVEPGSIRPLQAYRRALRQKARLLLDGKRMGRRLAETAAELRPWHEELALQAEEICRGRATYIQQLSPLAGDAYSEIAGGGDRLDIRYRPSLESVGGSKVGAELREDIRAEFDYIVREEIRRGKPLAGPQADDFGVDLGGRSLRTFGSQGETRLAAIAMILAQSEVVHRRRGVRPVLFFDDIFSELDRTRSRRLQERASRDHQVFIATARPEDVVGWRPPDLRCWTVTAGEIRLQPL